MANTDTIKFLTPVEAPGVVVTGDIIVQGESTVSSLETVVTKENTIKLRNEATHGLISGEYTGIVAEKYDGTNNGMLVFDSEGTAYVGDEGDLQPLATRQLSTDNAVVKWDDNKKTLVDTKIKHLDNGSIILGDGNATGSYAIAGGTTNSSLLQNMGIPSGISLASSQAKGTMSLAFGVDANAESVASISMGYATIAGAKGYYYREINFTNKTIELSTSRTSLSSPSSINWEVGDKLSIVCNGYYPYTCEITSINGTIITVDSIPFTEDDYHNAYYTKLFSRWIENVLSYTSPEARTIINVNKPNSGVVELGFGAVAIGYQNKVSGTFSQSFGYNNITVGNYAFSSGNNTKAIGNQSHTEGYFTEAIGDHSHAEGNTTVASGNNSHTEGQQTQADGNSSHAEGYLTKAIGEFSHTEGQQTQADGNNSHAEGYLTKAIGEFSHTEGRETQADGKHAHAEGRETIASGYHTHAEGYQTQATNTACHAEGYGTQAIGYVSHAEGYGTHATGKNSHAEGEKTTASGLNSHAEGFNTTAAGVESHAGGRKTSAIGVQSYAEGVSNTTYDEILTLLGDKELNIDNIISIWETNKFLMAYGKYSHAEGENTLALGRGSHAEGINTTAWGTDAHAEGYKTIASNMESHAEGWGTKASGKYSHSEGKETNASGECSHAGGKGTIASAVAQTAIGKYNKENVKALFIVGNGTSDTERSNAFTVTDDGAIILGVASYGTNDIGEGADLAPGQLYFVYED